MLIVYVVIHTFEDGAQDLIGVYETRAAALKGIQKHIRKLKQQICWFNLQIKEPTESDYYYVREKIKK